MAYPDSVRLEICERIAKGESMVSICASEGMPVQSVVYNWLSVDSEFAERYARAREQQAEHYLDEIIAISDDVTLDKIVDSEGNERTNNEAIQRSRLKVDTRKWAMSKLAPKKYGDKITQEHTGANGTALQPPVFNFNPVKPKDESS
jgi:hypothetical protein